MKEKAIYRFFLFPVASSPPIIRPAGRSRVMLRRGRRGSEGLEVILLHDLEGAVVAWFALRGGEGALELLCAEGVVAGDGGVGCGGVRHGVHFNDENSTSSYFRVAFISSF